MGRGEISTAPKQELLPMGRGERGTAPKQEQLPIGQEGHSAEARAAADWARGAQRRSKSSYRWGGTRGAAPKQELLPMGRGEMGCTG
jgi:hypothetical protein